MATSIIYPHKNYAVTEAFNLTSVGADGATYKVAGRALACPYSIEMKRKLTPSTSAGNDHLTIRIARVERNTTNLKLATGQVLIDISIPKDTSIIGTTAQTELLRIASSLLDDYGTGDNSSANIAQILSGGDL